MIGTLTGQAERARSRDDDRHRRPRHAPARHGTRPPDGLAPGGVENTIIYDLARIDERFGLRPGPDDRLQGPQGRPDATTSRASPGWGRRRRPSSSRLRHPRRALRAARRGDAREAARAPARVTRPRVRRAATSSDSCVTSRSSSTSRPPGSATTTATRSSGCSASTSSGPSSTGCRRCRRVGRRAAGRLRESTGDMAFGTCAADPRRASPGAPSRGAGRPRAPRRRVRRPPALARLRRRRAGPRANRPGPPRAAPGGRPARRPGRPRRGPRADRAAATPRPPRPRVVARGARPSSAWRSSSTIRGRAAGTPLALAVAGAGWARDRVRGRGGRDGGPARRSSASGCRSSGHEVKPLLVARFADDPRRRRRLPVAFDTQVAAYILNAALRSQTIADVVAEQLDHRSCRRPRAAADGAGRRSRRCPPSRSAEPLDGASSTQARA